MQEIALSRIAGVFLVSLGMMAMIAWFAHLTSILTFFPGYITIVFNSAVCFSLAGLAFLAPQFLREKAYYVTGAIIMLIAALTASESLFGYSLGIDTLFIKPWFADQNPHPGRMTESSITVFFLASLTYILLPHAKRKVVAIITQFLIFDILILGLTALLGHLLGLEALYSSYQQTRISLYSALCETIMGFGLWVAWKNTTSYEAIYAGKEDRKIILLVTTITTCIVLLSGLIIASVFPHKNEISFQAAYAQVLPVVLLATLVGVGLLLWQMIPLIRRILRSDEILIEANLRLREAEEQSRHLAYHDALTGLFNRNKLEQQMEEILSMARRQDKGFALIFIDLDHFKNINDTMGHDAGDLLLQVVSERLKNTVRTTDIAARLGGDEFVIVISDSNKVDQIAGIVQKILASLQRPIIVKAREIYSTMSIGISVYPYDGHDIKTLMKNADLALYRAKEVGRNNYQFCTAEMTAKAQEKMARQNAMVQALAKGEFILNYQPKLDVVHQCISGVEALLRWTSETYGRVSPHEIILLAEETGLIIPLNEWVLRTACRQVKSWQDAGISPLTVSVNLSARQFKQANLAERILQILKEENFNPHDLELEITENLIMQDPEYVLKILHSLKESGIHIAIDDFGTGYSSLDYLRRFKIDKIKIDKKFVQRVTIDVTSASIVTAMIAMANKLGIQTIAEGVETHGQYDFLLQEKCTEIQGYYLSPPLDITMMTRFLENPITASYLMRMTDEGSASA